MDTIGVERQGLWMEYATSIRLLGWVEDKADSEAEASQVSFSEWIAARSLISSRAFYVDPLHKTAMVPLADVFNHKAAIMDIPEDAVIAEEDEEEEEEEEEERYAVRGKASDKGKVAGRNHSLSRSITLLMTMMYHHYNLDGYLHISFTLLSYLILSRRLDGTPQDEE